MAATEQVADFLVTILEKVARSLAHPSGRFVHSLLIVAIVGFQPLHRNAAVDCVIFGFHLDSGCPLIQLEKKGARLPAGFTGSPWLIQPQVSLRPVTAPEADDFAYRHPLYFSPRAAASALRFKRY